MKKPILLAIFSLLTLAACDSTNNNNSGELPTIHSPTAEVSGGYVGSDYEGNYLWGGAMNLAWNDLSESILKEPLALNTDDEAALAITQAFNDSVFTTDDLDEESYYIKSGHGQETVDQINKESREKFPEKSFADLDSELGPTDIIAYAYFLKEVEYLEPFQVKEVEFEDETVNGFEADETRNIGVINYWSDDQFLIHLPLKDDSDELILAKGFSMETPEEALDRLSEYDQIPTERMRFNDRFEVPMISLDYHRNYTEMIGKFLANEDFEDYKISKMYEKIKFTMDEVGAKVENEAVIELESDEAGEPDFDAPPPPPPRNFILDEPFWVIMKRADSEVPYFMIGVRNTEFMEVVSEE